MGEQIASQGLPLAVSPLVVAIAGTGNVSRGAIDALSALSDDVLTWVSPDELPRLSALHGTEGEHQRRVYACVVPTEDMVEPVDASEAFDRQHYYSSPHEYRPTFHRKIAPHTSLLVTTRERGSALPGDQCARRLRPELDLTYNVQRVYSLHTTYYTYYVLRTAHNAQRASRGKVYTGVAKTGTAHSPGRFST